MTSYVKGALGYFTSHGNTTPEVPVPTISQSESSGNNDYPNQDNSKNKTDAQQGYLGKAATGIYSVGSTTLGASFNGVKWIAGTSYNVSSGVIGAVSSTVVGTAGGIAGAVTSGTSAIISKVATGSKKEHSD